MRVRVLFRTHYQVDQPAQFLILIQGCTTATQSEYAERVAARLSVQAKFNEAAALYAVELARSAELVNERMIWTPLGLLLSLVSRPAAELLPSGDLLPKERLAVLRAFLESDGACLLWLARRLSKDGEIVASEVTSNPLARDMFLEIYAQYLEVIQDLSDRQRLRGERDRLSRDGFQGKTGKHKMWLHLELLHRTGLCERYERDGSRVYSASNETLLAQLTALGDALPDVSSLERYSAAGELTDVACRIVPMAPPKVPGVSVSDEIIRDRIRAVVRRIRTLGIELSPIATIADVVQIQATADGERTLSSSELRATIQAMHRADPRKVRLHVDRNGRIAYVLSDE